VRGRFADGDYTRFLEATLGLVDAATACAPGLSTRCRIGMGAAILRLYEADRSARTALVEPEPRRLERAAMDLCEARATLADASREATIDTARRRSLALVV
jgi:hypothetical protein